MGKKQGIIGLAFLILFSACWTPINMNTVSAAVRIFELRAQTYRYGSLDRNWGQYIENFPPLHDYREARPWIGVSLSNKYEKGYGRGYSTEVSYWLYHIEEEKYWGPFDRESYENFIATLDLTEELTLATWEEILQLDYREKSGGPDWFRTPTGVSYYFDDDDSFSNPPQGIIEERKRYFDSETMPDGMAPYTIKDSYPDDHYPWLNKNSGECSWQLKYNRRNYFNNFYREFGYAGDIREFRLRAGERNLKNIYVGKNLERMLLEMKHRPEEEKQLYAHYARQLEAMQQAFHHGDIVELKRLQDKALAENELYYPCP